LALSLLSVGARPACRWPLLLSCHHGSRPSRPYTSTAGQSHGQGACKAADDCGAHNTVLPLAEARAGVAVPPPSGDAAAAPTKRLGRATVGVELTVAEGAGGRGGGSGGAR